MANAPADVAEQSVEHAIDRYNDLTGVTFPATFVCANCFKVNAGTSNICLGWILLTKRLGWSCGRPGEKGNV